MNEPREVVIDVKSLRHRARWGFPLTRDEERWLVEQVSGVLPGNEKRCYACNETGIEQDALCLRQRCAVCNGRGRIEELIVYRVVESDA